MTDLEKKLNKIYNYADLIHTENNPESKPELMMAIRMKK